MNLSDIIQIAMLAIIVAITLKITNLILTHGGPKEPSLVGRELSRDELFLQIDYLCAEHRRVSEENERLKAEGQALREKSVY